MGIYTVNGIDYEVSEGFILELIRMNYDYVNYK